jgi:hypothetical protein
MTAPPHSRFDLTGTQLTDAGLVRWLAQQPDPSQPILLTLDHNQLTRAGMDSLAAAALHFLSSLSASHNPIGDEGLRVIATSALFESVESLALADAGITAAGAKVVIGPDSVYGLSLLDLSANALGDEGVEAIAASPYGSYLRTLYLNEVGATDRAARALASSPHLADLGYLELKGNTLTDAGLAALRASPHLAGCTIETGAAPASQ